MVFPTYDAIRDQATFKRPTHELNLPLADRTIPGLSAIHDRAETLMPAPESATDNIYLKKALLNASCR